MAIPVEIAAPRVRRALKQRSGRAWSVVRTRSGRTTTGLRISASSRTGNPDAMTLDQRKELANLLGYPLGAIGAGGVIFTNDQLEVLVGKAERGLTIT